MKDGLEFFLAMPIASGCILKTKAEQQKCVFTCGNLELQTFTQGLCLGHNNSKGLGNPGIKQLILQVSRLAIVYIELLY